MMCRFAFRISRTPGTGRLKVNSSLYGIWHLCPQIAKMAALPSPVSVSPLIKFGRWSALLLGFAWGSHRYNVHTREEARLREIEEKQRVVRDATKVAEKAKLTREEMIYLAKESGVPVPANF